ncbi:MAG TPA: hypothetical protein PKY82_25300 [Pyrinomonadaceae bacterium]|nr:hypothetical protein [Pyrinomonadaceae bacterium]
MKKYFALFAIVLFAVCVKAQGGAVTDAASLELAKATLKAHGGEKLSQAKTLVLRGTADVTAPGSTFSLPAGFAIITAGEKYRLDIQAGLFNFLQVSDGQNTSSSMPGVTLPPMNRVGLFILPKIEEAGYIVSVLPEKFKKKKGFRVTSPEGYYSDFLVDEKNSRVKEFESSYELNGRLLQTAVAIEKYREIDGVLVNEKFSQRLDLGGASAYANFNAKDILINSEVNDDVFTIK